MPIMAVYRTTARVKAGTVTVEVPSEFRDQEVEIVIQRTQPSADTTATGEVSPPSLAIPTFHCNAELVRWLRANPPAPDDYADVGDDSAAWVDRQRQQRRTRDKRS
jgi:GrpB-like predicted nucleotidyltransferase (UPF0157 family)